MSFNDSADRVQLQKYMSYLDHSGDSADDLKKHFPKSEFIENKETDTQGFMILVEGELIVCFRGTEKKFKDWVTDANAFHQIYPYGNVNSKVKTHKGVTIAYKSVRDIIIDYISSNLSMVKRITIIGHSLGGGLAQLCAIDVQYNYPRKYTKMFTWGSMRVGNKYFAKSFNIRVPHAYRVYIKKDIVPNVPPSWLGRFKGGFKHIGFKYNTIAEGPNKSFRGALKLMRFALSGKLSSYTLNHSINLYRKFNEKGIANSN